jgi:undecaprenyl-diphosphatase
VITRGLRVTTRFAARLLVVWAALAVLGVLVTGLLRRPLAGEDRLSRALAAARDPAQDQLTHVLSALGHPVTVAAVTALVALALRRVLLRWAEAGLVGLAVAGQAVVVLLTALVIDREPPAVPRLDVAGRTSGFLDGHTSGSTALYAGCALLLARSTRPGWAKVAGVAVLGVVPLLVGYARLYRGMEHPSDVAASYLNGLACLALAAAALHRRRGGEAPDPRRAPALAGAL